MIQSCKDNIYHWKSESMQHKNSTFLMKGAVVLVSDFLLVVSHGICRPAILSYAFGNGVYCRNDDFSLVVFLTLKECALIV